jgi:hypothetical protein
MTRNLKAFGLALVAAMALGAIGAQGASAVVEHSFRMGAEKTVVTGQNESYTTGNSREVIQFTPGLTISCDVTLSGTHIGAIRDTITVHPQFHNCTSSLGGAPTIHTGGCNYELSSDTTTSPAHFSAEEHAAWSLECESPHSASPHVIEMTAPGCNFSWETTHAGSVTVNHSLHGVRYTQLVNHSGKHALTVKSTIRTIKFTATAGSLCGLAGHPAGTYGSSSIDGLTSLTSYVDSSSTGGSTTNGFTWSHGAQVDLTLSTPT